MRSMRDVGLSDARVIGILRSSTPLMYTPTDLLLIVAAYAKQTLVCGSVHFMRLSKWRPQRRRRCRRTRR